MTFLLSKIMETAGRAVLIIGAFAIFLVGIVTAVHPAAASSAFSTIAASVSCATTGTTSCQTVTNTSSGIGLQGVSKSGAGLRGTSTSGIGVKGSTTTQRSYGVFGEAYPGSSTTQSGTGVGGLSEYGTGVSGVSTSGTGVSAVSSSGAGITASGDPAMLVNPGAIVSLSNGGDSDYAYLGLSTNGNAYYSYGAGQAVFRADTANYGLYANTTGSNAASVYGTNSAGLSGSFEGFQDGTIALEAAANYKSWPLVLYSNDFPRQGNDGPLGVFSVDGAGDVFYQGTLTQGQQQEDGNILISYASRSAAPTTEDTGTAEMINGVALVRLDPVFAATIDHTVPYRVFVTPDGDTRGVYVSAKTTQSFLVRENQNGRSTTTIDYRIVAASRGMSSTRMAFVRDPKHFGPRLPKLRKLPTVHVAMPKLLR